MHTSCVCVSVLYVWSLLYVKKKEVYVNNVNTQQPFSSTCGVPYVTSTIRRGGKSVDVSSTLLLKWLWWTTDPPFGLGIQRPLPGDVMHRNKSGKHHFQSLTLTCRRCREVPKSIPKNPDLQLDLWKKLGPPAPLIDTSSTSL